MGRHKAEPTPLNTEVGSQALTPEAREQQMIKLAVDLAEQQLLNGTASSQVITHFLKLGSSKERLEQQIMQEQKKLIESKTEALQAQKRSEQLFTEAIEAMKKYSGLKSEEVEDEI